MSTFELNLLSNNKQGGNLPTSKLRDLFPASEKIRRRAFVLNSQENQRCEKFVQHVQYQERLQHIRFSRIRRHLELDAQKYEVYQKALYNCAKSQLPNQVAANKTHVRVENKYRRRLVPIIRTPREDTLSVAKNSHTDTLSVAKNTPIGTLSVAKNKPIGTLSEPNSKPNDTLSDPKNSRTDTLSVAKNKPINSLSQPKNKPIGTLSEPKNPRIGDLSVAKNKPTEKVEKKEIVDYNANVLKTIDEGSSECDESSKSEGNGETSSNTNIDIEESRGQKVEGDEEKHIEEVSNANKLFVKRAIIKRTKRQDKSNSLNERTYHLRSTPKTLSNLPPYGIYEGKVYRHFSNERSEAFMEIDPECRRKRRAEKLFLTAKSESSTLIDRRMSTSALFKDKDKPLKERLRPAKTVGQRLKPLRAKMKVMQVLLKMKTEAKEKQELYRGTDRFGRGLGLSRRKTGGNTFQTKIWD